MRTHHAGFFSTQDALYWYYPQIKRVIAAADKAPQLDRILVLSSSHLETPVFGKLLRERLAGDVEIVNVSRAGYTSFDAEALYRFFEKVHFKLVVFYNGLKNVRANNCPPAVFKTDYAHFSSYRLINAFLQHQTLIRYCSFPFTIDYLMQTKLPPSLRLFHIPDKITADFRKKGWTRYGGDIKTGPVFGKHLDAICSLACRKGEPVLIVGLCIFIDPNYSDSLFSQKALDYGDHAYPLEVYGSLENIRKGLRVHDSVSRGIAGKYPCSRYINLCAKIPAGKEYFNDPAHFTGRGMRVFAEHLADSIAPLLRQADHPR